MLWANVNYCGKLGMSEPRIAGCSGTERCAPIGRVTTRTCPRPITTLTVNAASACGSRKRRYAERALSQKSERPPISASKPPVRSGASPARKYWTGTPSWDVVMKLVTPEQRERDRARKKRWYQENRERRLAYFKHWREKAREQRRAYHERYHKENRERDLARKKRWYEDNREYLKEYRRRYRARQKELRAESP
jgi:hypothetical protein